MCVVPLIGSGYNIGLDDGQEITIFNVKQKGSDAYLGNVIINRSSVVFILSDGTSFSLPRKDGQIHFSSYEAITVNLLDTVEVLLPESFKKSDFAAFTAKVESGDGVATKAGDDDDDWKVKAIAPEFDAQGVLVKNPFVIFTRIPYEKTDAIINVSIIDNNGSKTGTSRVVYSGNFDKRDKVFEEWDALFESDMQKWNELHRMEFVIWYMMSLSEDQKEEMEESGDLDEDEEENNEEYMGVPLNGSLGMIDTGGKFYNWMGAGHRGWGLKTGLPDNRKVCHVALPAARDALSEKPIIPSEVGKIPALALFRLFRYQNVNMDFFLFVERILIPLPGNAVFYEKKVTLCLVRIIIIILAADDLQPVVRQFH